MNRPVSSVSQLVLCLLIGCILIVCPGVIRAQESDDVASPVTTIEDFRKARELGEKAESLEEKARHWRIALTWEAKDVEWLRLAYNFALDLRNVGGDPKHPYFEENRTIFREIVDRFDHMDFYDRRGAESIWADSIIVPSSACIGLGEYEIFLSMMQDIYEQRVKDYLAESIPVKPPELNAPFPRPAWKYVSHEQHIGYWLERRARACEGRVLTRAETSLIDQAVQHLAYRGYTPASNYDPVPDLAELATRYTVPEIQEAILKCIKVEMPPRRGIPHDIGRAREFVLPYRGLDGKSDPAGRLDFDTATFAGNPISWANRHHHTFWMKRHGLDIDLDYPHHFLMSVIAFDLELIEVPQHMWGEPPAGWEELKSAQVEKGALTYSLRDPGQRGFHIRPKAQLPVTLGFKTREGGVGIFQLTEVNEHPEHGREYKIRYKMIKEGKSHE